MRDISPEVLETLAKTRCFVLDMDGTIYLGDELFPATIPFLNWLRSHRRTYIFATNNSSVSGADYFEKLRKMGVPLEPGQVFTSGDATIRYLKQCGPERNIFLLGTPKLHADFEKNGFETTSAAPAYVVLGFDKTMTYESLNAACRHIRSGVSFIATHPDLNCPMPNDELLIDCGAISEAITAATGVKPKYIGKPHTEMVDYMINLAGVEPSQMAIIGDRLSTDIQAGVSNGVFSILVLSGATSASELEASQIQPDMVVSDLGELLQILKMVENDGANLAHSEKRR